MKNFPISMFTSLAIWYLHLRLYTSINGMRTCLAYIRPRDMLCEYDYFDGTPLEKLGSLSEKL